ncbi:ABC transporter ATP-binding protein/permease [Halobacteria archaeon HArc-gm2]|nr:ABC transporter ATP-binding protein/permease [Halobacteria archaeon HArc-gm2]
MSDDGESRERPDDIADAAETDWPLVDLIWSQGRPQLPYLGVSVTSLAFGTALDMADIFVLGIAIDAMFNGQVYALPLVPDALIPPEEEPLAQLWFTFYLLLGMKVADILAANLSQITRNVFAQRFLHGLRIDAFDTATGLELGFFEDSRTGDVMSVLNNDVNTLERFLTRGITGATRVVVVLVTSMGLMVLLNWQLALFVLAAAPLIAGVNWWFSQVLERLQDVVRSEVGDLNARLETTLSGIDVIKAFAAEPFESERVAEDSRKHRDARWGAKRVSARHRPSMRLISGASLLVTFVVGSVWVIDGAPLWFTGTLTAGELIPFLFYMQQLTGPMRWVAGVIETFKSAKAAAKRIVGLRDVDRRIDDAGKAELGDVDGDVEYDDVAFSYPGSGSGGDADDEPERVLDGMSFDVEAGRTVGIVGSTGAGKSTLIKLLLRFYDVRGTSGRSDVPRAQQNSPSSEDVEEGAVRVDGTDVRDVTRESLRRSIGYVDQDPFLFNGTVAENVAYGLHEDGTSDEAKRAAVERAAKEAGAHEFVERLPKGYDTEVGERGTKLSGGQRQRIAIARAVVGDPSILVFDEATSHVDNETEVLIQENLDDLTEDRTTFVIAHRLSTVRDADRILVLDDGELVEDGTHDELLEADGTYANLWRVQIGNVEALPDDFVERARIGDDD